LVAAVGFGNFFTGSPQIHGIGFSLGLRTFSVSLQPLRWGTPESLPSVKRSQRRGRSETDSKRERVSGTPIFVFLYHLTVSSLRSVCFTLFFLILYRSAIPDCFTLLRTELVRSEWGQRQQKERQRGENSTSRVEKANEQGGY